MTKPGPTGKFPQGKLDETDEGELTVAIGAWNGCVRVDFGGKIEWIALPPKEAIELGRAIINHALKLEKK